MSPLDLHVLGTPPAFVLSQDQTLPFNPLTLSCFTLRNLRCLSLILSDKPFPLRVSSLYRFQGSLGSPATSIIATPHRRAHSFRLTSPLKSFLPPAVFRGSPSGFRASLDRITKAKSFVKHFLAVFSEKKQADQRFRTMRNLPDKKFGFWPKISA